ncbi:putative zinc finger protein [Vigna angularis]|uniref:Putative zinc finger protein n=1 Tax=Phaseolus angularis TaxID=3914 RepID=A0A8T0KTR3_PHAAN|nr:putative zinc finger protein [Vigna angularis]
MDKVCEFCTALRPLVYCKADSAYLCLSCDAKVHLANALSGRHLRNLVCNSCGHHVAHVVCLNHKMLICRDCDKKLHNVSLSHQKRAIRSFIGCPSAKDFAALWGFELNEIENCASQDQFDSVSCVSAELNVAQVSGKPDIQNGVPSLLAGAKLDEESTGQQGQVRRENEFLHSCPGGFIRLSLVVLWCWSCSLCEVLVILHNHQERQTIVQQIIDLKWLQQNEEIDYSAKISRLKEKKSSPSLYHTLKKLDEKFNGQAKNSQDLATDVLEKDCPIVEPSTETLPSTFSQLDNLSSSSIIDLPLHGELFWTCRSPLRCNQLWSQNIQDLGICEELVRLDDFNIPDVDLTFQNFDELFGGDQDPIRILFDDQDVSCSSLEKDKSIDKSDIDNLSAMELFITITVQRNAIEEELEDCCIHPCDAMMDQAKVYEVKDSSASASINLSQSDHENKDMNPLGQYCPESMDPTHATQPFDSATPLSVLGISLESSFTHEDGILSPYSEGKAYSGMRSNFDFYPGNLELIYLSLFQIVPNYEAFVHLIN